MNAYRLPGYDFFVTTDPSDDGTQEALEQTTCELSESYSEVTDALTEVVEEDGLQWDLMVRAFTTGSDVEWNRVREDISAAITRKLKVRTVEVLKAQRDEAEMCAAESAV